MKREIDTQALGLVAPPIAHYLPGNAATREQQAGNVEHIHTLCLGSKTQVNR
jgi:hypothetical protein